MRTTIRLDDQLLALAKRRAIETHRTLTNVIEDALRALLARPAASKGEAPNVDLPVSGSGGVLPGVDLDSTAALFDMMDGRQ